MKKFAFVSLVTIAIGFFIVYGSPASATGQFIANPASVNCINQGGTLDLKREYGICKFVDGTECEEWAFFRGTCTMGQCWVWNLANNSCRTPVG